MTHYSYYIEVACLQASLVVLLLLILAQLLAYQVTARRLRLRVKLQMLTFASLAWLVQTVRCLDSSSVFGLIPVGPNRVMQEQITCLLIDATILLLTSSAKSLSSIIGRPLPRAFVPLFYGTAGLFHLAAFCVTVAEACEIAHRDRNMETLIRLRGARLTILDVTCALVIGFSWHALWGLRTQVAIFARTLSEQEKRLARTNHSRDDNCLQLELSTRFAPHSPTVVIDALPPADRATSPSLPAGALHFSYASSTMPIPSSARLAELDATVNKLNRLNIWINILLGVGIANNLPLLISWAQGTMDATLPDGNKPMSRLNPFYAAGQNIAIAVAIYSVWMDTSVWRRRLICRCCPARSSSSSSSSKQARAEQTQSCDATDSAMPTKFAHPDDCDTAEPKPLADSPLTQHRVTESLVAHIDSAASHAPTGLSMRSGVVSIQAHRSEGGDHIDRADRYRFGSDDAPSADDLALEHAIDHAFDDDPRYAHHARKVTQSHHPFAIAEEPSGKREDDPATPATARDSADDQA